MTINTGNISVNSLGSGPTGLSLTITQHKYPEHRVVKYLSDLAGANHFLPPTSEKDGFSPYPDKKIFSPHTFELILVSRCIP